jgi:transcriptional regulator with XRE-family HTH domain
LQSTVAKFIAMRIGAHRRASDWTQADLARAAGVSRSAITRLESGFTKDPAISLIARVASALGVPIRELMPPAPPPPRRRVLENGVQADEPRVSELPPPRRRDETQAARAVIQRATG